MNSITRIDALIQCLKKIESRKAKRALRVADNIQLGSKSTAKGPRTRVKRPKSLSTSKLEALRWKAYSAYIRSKPQEFNPGKCWYCGVGAIECAGHVISRQKRAIKYDDRNVFPSCRRCNWSDKYLPGFHDQMVSLYIERFGLPQYLELVSLSKTTVKTSRPETMEMTQKYLDLSNSPKDLDRK
jgi:hypothetical protein